MGTPTELARHPTFGTKKVGADGQRTHSLGSLWYVPHTLIQVPGDRNEEKALEGEIVVINEANDLVTKTSRIL